VIKDFGVIMDFGRTVGRPTRVRHNTNPP